MHTPPLQHTKELEKPWIWGLDAHDRECSSALRRPGVLVACSSVSGGRLLTTNLGERLGSARRLLESIHPMQL